MIHKMNLNTKNETKSSYKNQLERSRNAPFWEYHHYLIYHLQKYRKNPSRAVRGVEKTRQNVPYFSSFIAKSQLNDLEHKGHGQRSLHATHLSWYWSFVPNIKGFHPELYVPWCGHGKLCHGFLAASLQSHGWMTLKIQIKVKGLCARHTLSRSWLFVPNMETNGIHHAASLYIETYFFLQNYAYVHTEWPTFT